jgi:hypothetical protein
MTTTGDPRLQGVNSRLSVFLLTALYTCPTKASQYIRIMTASFGIAIGATDGLIQGLPHFSVVVLPLDRGACSNIRQHGGCVGCKHQSPSAGMGQQDRDKL